MSGNALVFAVLLYASLAFQPLWAQQDSNAPAQEPVELQIIRGSPDEAEYVVLERFVITPGTRVSNHYLVAHARDRAEALGATTLYYETFQDHGRRWRRGGGVPALPGLVGSCLTFCSTAVMAADFHWRYSRAPYRAERIIVALRGWAVLKRDADASH